MDFLDSLFYDKSARKRERELFGNRQNLDEDESIIVWDSKLTHEQKVAKLRTIRKAKGLAKRKATLAFRRTFDQRMSTHDVIRLHGLGVVAYTEVTNG